MPWRFHGYYLGIHSLGLIIYQRSQFLSQNKAAYALRFVIFPTNRILSVVIKNKIKIKDCPVDMLSCDEVIIRKFELAIANLSQ